MTKKLDDILQNLSHILIDNKLKLSLCESCTGGLLSKLCTDISGSSLWFKGSIVSYDNEIKEKIGVSEKTIKNFGAVSRETAMEMCKSALILTGSDICLSITGIAGPSGGTKEKPVGTVYFSYIDKSGYEYYEKYVFEGDRTDIRNCAAFHGFQIISKCVSESKTK